MGVEERAPGRCDTKAIRARADAATKGPWRDEWDAICEGDGSKQHAVLCGGEGLKGVVVGVTWWDGDVLILRKEDSAFIAKARTDVPALCDEVDRLRKTQDALVYALLEAEQWRCALCSCVGRHSAGCANDAALTAAGLPDRASRDAKRAEMRSAKP